MQVPRISAKAWFWSLTIALFLWAYVGTRTIPANGTSPSMMQSAQGIVGTPVQILTVPGTWIVSWLQRSVVWVFHSISATHVENETVETLEAKNKKLQDDLLVLNAQIDILNEKIRSMSGQKAHGLSPRDLVRANIIGHNPGAGAGTMTIDKGTADGVRAGYPVIAGENHIVGRVSVANPKTSTVRLITDPGSHVKATIVHPVPGGAVPLLKDACLVDGQGNGQFGTNTIPTMDAKIEPGDVVQLLDNEWPKKLQGFILGVVSEVGVNPHQMLRYEVRSRANINQIQSVDVLTNFD